MSFLQGTLNFDNHLKQILGPNLVEGLGVFGKKDLLFSPTIP